jgi:hypothetical protein
MPRIESLGMLDMYNLSEKTGTMAAATAPGQGQG